MEDGELGESGDALRLIGGNASNALDEATNLIEV